MDLAFAKNALRLELARRSILDFTTFTFPNYRTNWHHRVLADALDDLVFGRTTRLMVFMPPRHGKSELVSRRLPAFFLGNFPQAEVILASYSADLANRMNGNVQQIIEDPRYKAIFPHVRLPGGVGDPVRRYSGVRKTRTQDFFELVGNEGTLRSAGVGGGITGMGFNLGIIDDPVKDAEEGNSQVMRDKAWDWYVSTFYTRQTAMRAGVSVPGGGGQDARILLTMTRWHEDDLAGRLLRLARTEPGADQWRVISLPALSGPDPMSYAEYDERTEPDQALWADHPVYHAGWLKRTRANVPNFFWQAMYQQRPISEGAGYFKRKYFENTFTVRDGWVHRPNKPPVQLIDCLVVAGVDPASSEKQKADFTAIVIMAFTPDGDGLVLDVIRDRANPAAIPGLLARAAKRWPVRYFVFEADGFQTAVVAIARRDYPDLPPIREVRHAGKGKLVRATPAIVRSEQGQVLMNKESDAWREAFFDELEAFTGEDDRHDDQVDAFAYCIEEYGRFGGLEWVSVDRGAIRPFREPERVGSSAQRRGLFGLRGR